jgi:DNA-binding response OmpR family regulator
MRVLVADKDPYDLEAYASAIEAPDVEVFTARDGDETIRLAHEHTPDVIVGNASLGRMGAFAISRDLKTMAGLGELPEPKIFVLLEREADAWLAAKSLCDLWRTKPIEPAEVERIVRELHSPPDSPELEGTGEPVAL